MSQELDCDVAVIGAGIIGACIALELAERGLKVFIFDPESPCSKTSYGNAGVISPWTCVPQSMPGLWRQIPNWLADPDGPVSIRPGYFPKLLPWALRFFSAGRENRIDQIGDALFALSQGSVNAYKKRLKGTGYDHLVHDALYVHVYQNKSSASLDHRGWIMRRDRQVPVELIDRETLKKLEPEISQAYNAAIIIKNQGRAKDPARIGTSIMKKAFSCRARHLQKKVNAIQPDHGNGCKIITDDHEYKSNNIVIAAGVWSKRLLQNFGFTVPLEAERGYHVIFLNPEIEINNSVMDADGKFVASSMNSGIRIAGTAEFSGLNTKANFNRSKILAKQGKKLFPRINVGETKVWMGSRPSFPDSLPCLGKIPGLNGIIAAFGHSHYGLGMAPKTSEIIADCITGEAPKVDLKPYAISRFK